MAPQIEECQISAFTIPTDQPESDGTLQWDSTTLVLVELAAAGATGIGYTYSCPATATLIDEKLRSLVVGANPMNIAASYHAMVHHTRNLGRPGIVSMAISAVDVALWDLKCKLLKVSLAKLLGQVRDAVPVYGSGGFTSYSDDELREQTSGWVKEGIRQVKMKVGRDTCRDPHRVKIVRDAIGDAGLFVDANGGYSRKQAVALMHKFADLGVTWFEEPVSSDDLEGLRLIRDANVPNVEVTAGEYGFQPSYFRRMLELGAVDVLQADATRCGGITGFLAAAAISDAFLIPLSSHCAPSLHMHLGCAIAGIRHLEYFHDHVRIEQKLFDGFVPAKNGKMKPSMERFGLGLEFKSKDAEMYRRS
ncbi:enolase C-terminal domain-like protein [Novipirellula rosea]|uniref:Enolase C-terminal domain-like protein n=1 Tax=Novipirellula rosea TaxID=1031540 RepID=A0ABP8NN07_9BACT